MITLSNFSEGKFESKNGPKSSIKLFSNKIILNFLEYNFANGVIFLILLQLKSIISKWGINILFIGVISSISLLAKLISIKSVNLICEINLNPSSFSHLYLDLSFGPFNLSYNKIKNITPLTKLYSKKLSFILLENNLIEDLGPFLDSNFPSLTILKVINNNSAFEKNNFKSVLKKFEGIIIYQLKWNDFSKRYKLDNNKINEENFKKANKLDLSSRGCGDIILNDLFPLINSHIRIIYLILDNNRLNDVSLLDKMPLYYLEYLDLSLNLITSIEFLKKLFVVSRNLKVLYLQDNKINDITPFLNEERKIAIKLEILTLKNNCLNLKEKETLDVFNKLFKIEGLTLDYQKDDLNLWNLN